MDKLELLIYNYHNIIITKISTKTKTLSDNAILGKGEKLMIFESKDSNTNLPYVIAHQAKLQGITTLVFSYDEVGEEVNLQKFCIDKRLKRDDCSPYQVCLILQLFCLVFDPLNRVLPNFFQFFNLIL